MKDWIYVLRVRTGSQSGFGDNMGRCIVYFAEVAITQQFCEAVSLGHKGLARLNCGTRGKGGRPGRVS
jgi:hypothetical protein